VVDSRTEAAPNVRHLHLMDVGVYSAIRAPLVVHDTVRGAVSLWGEGTGRFTTEDAELLGTLTRPLALALEKASALESLGESELKYRSLVAQAEEMIFLFDPKSLRILDANSFTSRALGYAPQELAALTLDRIVDSTAEELARNVAATVSDGEYHLTDATSPHGRSPIDVDAVASMVTFGAPAVPSGATSPAQGPPPPADAEPENGLSRAMAGAVAHDFNNLLTTILASQASSARNMTRNENLASSKTARHAADLTGPCSPSRGGLARLAAPIPHCRGGRCNCRTDHARQDRGRPLAPAHAGPAEGDAGQLQQAHNIVLNARDAMPEGGSIDVSLAIEGAVAVLTITDTGPGMDEETRMRIFEPFYTTKPSGSGTGLGMAITYGIIQGHHGDIALRSAPGEGTQFTISLPLLDYATDDAPADAFNAGRVTSSRHR
jgi:signal transduction histidine kinase